MASEEGAGGTSAGNALADLARLVSLNQARYAGLPLHDLTTADLRKLLGIGRGGPVADCGCDAGPDGNCGCRGLDCPCNKQKSGDWSFDDWLIDHERTVAELRAQLEQQRVTDEQVNRLQKEH
jgi:hypothetical protein